MDTEFLSPLLLDHLKMMENDRKIWKNIEQTGFADHPRSRFT